MSTSLQRPSARMPCGCTVRARHGWRGFAGVLLAGLLLPVLAMAADAPPTPAAAPPVEDEVPIPETPPVSARADQLDKLAFAAFDALPDPKTVNEARAEQHYRAAIAADREGDYLVSEELFLKILFFDLPEELRRAIILRYADMAERMGDRARITAVYERFAEEFAQDRELPAIFMKLGQLYREMGAFDLSLANFYKVLNVSLAPVDGLDQYRALSRQAQLEIAETHYANGDYEEAEKFYARLEMLALDPATRLEVAFKVAHSAYLRGEYARAARLLETFLKDHGDTVLAPEGHFLLANSYKEIGRADKAVAEVLKLLSYKETRFANNRPLWLYWKQRTGNQMANEYYEQGDFRSALQIYRSMVTLSSNPVWQWPVLYQIGLCYERLRLHQRAKDTFTYLADGGALADNENRLAALPADVRDLRDLASWRLEHLRWATATESELARLTSDDDFAADVDEMTTARSSTELE